MIFPKPLFEGANVALVAPSGPVPSERLEPAVESVRRLGLKPVVYQSCRMSHGYLAGSDEQRAKDINEAFADDVIDGIICIRGGYGAHRLMPLLDYGMIRRKPKLLCGYSDITALHIVLNQKCGLATWHTPMPNTEWSKGLDPFTSQSLRHALFGPRPRRLENPQARPLLVLSPGYANGRLTGGNLSLVTSTIGTPYEINTMGKILFLEDIGEEPYRLDRMLLQLKHAGKFSDCAGVLFGAFTGCEAKEPEKSLTIQEVMAELVLNEGKPVLAGLQCGHVLPTMSLPLGARALMDTDKGIIRVEEG